uniref:NADPH oxidase organizer 1 n=1 Tax=Nothoprocta perdicaria TaxID=30464 RepID=A0A8C6ZUZ1_NOTPE
LFQNYMMSVSWSDRNTGPRERVSQQRFSPCRFQKELKRKFPIESGSLRRSDRALPKLKGEEAESSAISAPLSGCGRSGKLSKSLERLRLLETYSQELLKMDAKISQSETLTQFFKAQTRDLEPSFPENSVVIMPSEIGAEKKKGRQQQHVPSITQPQASQSYRCIEAFETKDTKNKTFKVAKKEIVEVLIKDMTGWWLVENADKQIAWFPAPYLQGLDARGDGPSAPSCCLYFAARAYESQEADELSLNNGVLVEVVRKSEDGWWLSRYAGGPKLLPAPAPRDTQCPHLTQRDRNDSSFAEPRAAPSSCSLDSEAATCTPQVPTRPSALEILQRCSTVTRRACGASRRRAGRPGCTWGVPAARGASRRHVGRPGGARGVPAARGASRRRAGLLDQDKGEHRLQVKLLQAGAQEGSLPGEGLQGCPSTQYSSWKLHP